MPHVEWLRATGQRATCAAVVLCLCTATAPASEPQIAAAAVLQDHYPPQVVNFPEGVKGYANLVYSVPPGYQPLKLDLYAKPAGSKPRPLVVYVHGGGWMGGHSRNSGAFVDFPRVLADLAASGYVVASVNYRLSGEARFPAAIQDVKLALRWLRVHATDYGIDPDHVIIWGASAGGELAGLVATTCGNEALAPVIAAGPGSADAPLSKASDCVQGAVLWYGALDLTQTHEAQGPQSAEGRYLGCAPAACPEVARLASPNFQISSATPPVLLALGNNDKVVPPVESEEFHRRMLAAGRQCDLLEMDGIGHSFVGKDQAVTRKASLTALDATIRFFHRIALPVL